MFDPDIQKTLAGPASYSGIALHTGQRARITFMPAPADSGIVFRRVDLPGRPEVQAIGSNVTEVMRGTTIKNGDAVIHTVEHVIAALVSQGIDNCLIEMDRSEPPIADGSSMPFIEVIDQAGIVELGVPRRYFRVTRPHFLELKHALITLVPDDKFRISCTVKYDQSQLDVQFYQCEVTPETFRKELSRARTFCSLSELDQLMKAGLIRGGSLDNANIIDGSCIFSKDGLRYPDELVRHKMLDIVGDFALLGRPLKGHIVAVKSGHPSNVTMVQKLLQLEKEGQL